MKNKHLKNTYIYSPWFDRIFFIFSPFVALSFVLLICEPRKSHGSFIIPQETYTSKMLVYWVLVLTFVHIFPVFIRSYFNKTIFNRFRKRFLWAPLIIFLSLAVSPWFFGIMFLVAIEWDEIHTLLQSFGFGRIYDSKVGSDPTTGRKLDMGLCFFFEYLPHLILLTFMPEREYLGELKYFIPGIENFSDVVPALKVPLIGLSVLYLGYYLCKYYHYSKNGYQISRNKILMYSSTFIATQIVIWNYTVVEATVMGNIYHAIQYLAIVWVSEKDHVHTTLNKKGLKVSLGFISIFLLLLFFMLGILREKTQYLPVLAAFWLSLSLLHFWYDGFIWSVKKKDI